MTNKHTTVDYIRRAAELQVNRSRYRNSSANLKNAYIQGWLLSLLADRWHTDPELRRSIQRLVDSK